VAQRLSYSYLNSYKTCPKQFYHLRVAKDYPWPKQGVEAKEGERKHSLMENRLLYSTYTGLHQLESACNDVISRGGFIVCEHKMCLDAAHEPVRYDDWKNGYIGGLADVLSFGVDGEFRNALIIDWKFGKFYPDPFQLMVMAVLTMHTYPWIASVESALVYPELGRQEVAKFTYADLSTYWAAIETRHTEIKQSRATNVWVANQSGLCRKHCNITECQHNGV
jgi:hypothetical protein